MRITKYFLQKKAILKIIISVLLMVSVCLQSCINDKYDLSKTSKQAEFNPSLALSVGTTIFRMNDVLKNLDSTSLIQHYPSGLLYLVYEKDLIAYRGDSVITIPSQNPLPIPLPSVLLPANFSATGIAEYVQAVDFPFLVNSGQTLDSIDIKDMIFTIAVSPDYNQPGTLIISFPDLVKNKQVYADTFNIIAGTYTNQTQNKNAAGYRMKITNTSGSPTIPVKLDFKLTGTPNSPVLPGLLTINISVGNLKYYAIYGYIGKNNLLNVTDSFDISILNHNLVNNIHWANPSIRILTKNSYIVVPVNLLISDMKVFSSVNNHFYDVNISPTINPYSIKYPPIAGRIVTDSVVYDTSNTNLFTQIQKAPQYLRFHVDANSNPNGNTGKENMVMDSSTVKVNVRFTLPISFSDTTGFGTTDTLNMDLSKSFGKNGDSIQINSMLFRIISENGFPINMNLQLILADSGFNHKDTLVNQQILRPGLVVNGKVLPYTIDIPYPSKTDKVSSNSYNLNKTKKLLAKVQISTATSTFVNFYSYNYLKLSFAFQIKPKIKVNL
jgi:hypothetical protein